MEIHAVPGFVMHDRGQWDIPILSDPCPAFRRQPRSQVFAGQTRHAQ